MKALLQLRSELFITLFIAYMKDQSAAVSVSLDFKISSSTTSQPGLPPFQRTTTGFVPTPSCSQLLPVQADTLITLTLLLGDTNSQTAMTTLPGLHLLPSFPPSLHPSLWQPEASWVSVYLLLWCSLAA